MQAVANIAIVAAQALILYAGYGKMLDILAPKILRRIADAE